MQPKIDLSLCTRCGLCSADCPSKAINPATMDVRLDHCMGCGHCFAICPSSAVSYDKSGETGPDFADSVSGLQGDFETLVAMRRSVRRYKAQEIASGQIARILELVRFAPTGTHTQAVNVTVLASRRQVQGAVALALNFYRRLASLALNPVVFPLLGLFAGKTLATKLKAYKKHLDRAGLDENDIMAHNAPALFIFHAPKKSSTPAEDAVIWASTAALHAQTMGIGTCYNGFMTRAINGSKELRSFLGLPEGSRVYSCFTAGYPATTYQRPAPRKVLDACVLG